MKVAFEKADQPILTEVKGKDYIAFGETNQYPDYLLSLYNESAKHGAIIKGKVNYIFGKGLENDFEFNTQGETANDVLKKCVLDYELFGGYYLQVTYNALGRVADIYHIEYHKVRSNKDNTKFAVKNDWRDNKETIRYYDAYDPSKGDGKAQIIFIKDYNPCNAIYPMPSYTQAMNYIDSDVQVSRHILGNAKHGFVASTLVNLNNGEAASDEEQEEIEKGLKKKFTGSEGDRVILMFNPSRENSAEIIQLGNTMLTKEDFTNINNLIQQEIFAGHSITSPMLFGIKTQGQLGGRTELRDAYEIFNNTYVNERQQYHEKVFNKLATIKGITLAENKIVPVEPLGFEFSEQIIAANMTQDEIRGKLGLQPINATQIQQEQTQVNSNLANMTGRQFQQLERIKRKYKNGQLTKEEAALMLKSSFGLSDTDVNIMLGIDDDPLTADEQQFNAFSEDDRLLHEFSLCGEDVSLYEEVSRKPAASISYFAEVNTLNKLQSNILTLIRKDNRITPEVIAETLKADVGAVKKSISNLVDKGYLTETTQTIGQDMQVERELTSSAKTLDIAENSSVTELLIRYTYAGPKDSKNRPFCAKMLELSSSKVWSRSDIEKISERLGYSVWDRRGGWFTQPNGEPRPSCRHRWDALIVTRKK